MISLLPQLQISALRVKLHGVLTKAWLLIAQAFLFGRVCTQKGPVRGGESEMVVDTG